MAYVFVFFLFSSKTFGEVKILKCFTFKDAQLKLHCIPFPVWEMKRCNIIFLPVKLNNKAENPSCFII